MNADHPYPYEDAAELFAFVAYPKDEARQAQAVATLRRRYAAWLVDATGEAAKPHLRVTDLLSDAGKVEAYSRKLEPLLRKRLLAGHIGRAYIEDELQQRPTRLTHAAMAEREGVNERGLRRLLNEAAPAFQLCTALAETFQRGRRQAHSSGGEEPDIFTLMRDPGFVPSVLGLAHIHEALIARVVQLEAVRRRMLRLEESRAIFRQMTAHHTG
ncbi:MAG: hypothetical protein O9257_02700 [Brevundimonas sp.]|jgi:hypothetical protein|nr:hypothetical protein [Brevundimonas sp.]